MEIEFTDKAKKDLDFWKRSGNIVIQRKITALLKEIEVNPYFGTGQVEQLKADLSGYWSRRLNREHRIVYRVDEDLKKVHIFSLKGHYEKL